MTTTVSPNWNSERISDATLASLPGASSDFGDVPPTMTSLTPDALMAYCTARLDAISSQATSIFDQQQNSAKERDLVNGLVQQFQGLSTTGTTTSPDQVGPNQATCITLEGKIDDAIAQIKQMDPNSPAIAQLEQIHDNVMETGSGPYTADGVQHGYYGTPNANNSGIPTDNNLSGTEIQSFVSDLQSVNTSLNSQAELQMIQLQSLMSQRQTAIQLTTNLVQSFGDQDDKIAENIGH